MASASSHEPGPPPQSGSRSGAQYADLLLKASEVIGALQPLDLTRRSAKGRKDRVPITETFGANKKGLDELTTLIDDNPLFGDLRQGYLGPPNPLVVRSTDISRIIVRCGITGWRLEEVIEQLIKFAQTRSISTSLYFALNGLRVERRIQCAEDLAIIPWSDVPHSRRKDYFGQDKGLHRPPPAEAAIEYVLGAYPALRALSDVEESKDCPSSEIDLVPCDEDGKPFDLIRCIVSFTKDIRLRDSWFHVTPPTVNELLMQHPTVEMSW